MFVDTHVHIVSEDNDRYPTQPMGQPLGWVTQMPVSAEGLMKFMDEAGVDRATLVQALSSHGFDNTYVSDMAELYPSRFTSVCIIDMVAEDRDERLKHWIVERKMRGIRLYTYLDPDAAWLDDPKTYPVWELAASERIPITVLLRAERFPRLRRILQKFPDVSVALEHLGHTPFSTEAPFEASKELLDLADLPNLHLKYTSVNLDSAGRGGTAPEHVVQALVSGFGAQRVLWGSNFPATFDRSYKELVELARRSVSSLPEGEQRLVLGENALRLWPSLK